MFTGMRVHHSHTIRARTNAVRSDGFMCITLQCRSEAKNGDARFSETEFQMFVNLDKDGANTLRDAAASLVQAARVMAAEAQHIDGGDLVVWECKRVAASEVEAK